MIQPVGFPLLPLEFDYETEVHESLDREYSIFFNIYRKRGVIPKRALLVIHGQGEHGARYQHFCHYLKHEYDFIIAPDLRGHGRSEGKRGHVRSFDEYVDDAMLAWDILSKKIPEGTERDWFAHSMGGLVTLRAFHYRPEIEARHLILSSPCLGLKVKVPLVKDLAAKLLTRVWGSIQLDSDLDTRTISHDPNVVEAYENDQLIHSKATPMFYLSFLDVMKEMSTSELRFPPDLRLLFQLAGEDQIVSNEATQHVFDHIRQEDKKIIIYPGLYHEIYNEPTRAAVFEDWIKWLKC